MKLLKLDGPTWIVLMIASIFIPGLFAINMIIFLCQVIPRVIKEKQEQKERDAYNDFLIQSEIENNQSYSINENDKKIVNEKLDVIKQSHLGETADRITYFQFNLLNNILIKKDIYDFIDFLISLYPPKEICQLLPDGCDLGTSDINDCIEILQNNLN